MDERIDSNGCHLGLSPPAEPTSTKVRLKSRGNSSISGRASIRSGGPAEIQLQPIPDLDQRLGQLVHHGFAVRRPRREAQPFGSARNGREIDRLNIEPVFGEQDVADPLRFGRA